MKKYFLLGLIAVIAPNICFGASASYTQLVREKQRKMEELEKCMGSSKGLKIAGISTIGLTAVGVAGNIAEAQKLQEYDEAIDKKNKDIETKQKAIVAEQEKIKEIEAEKKKAEEEAARKKAEEQAAKEAKKDKDKVEVVDIVSQQPTVDGQILTGVVSGDNNFIWNPVNINDTGSASGSTSSINNNNDLATDKPGTPKKTEQGNGSVTKTTTNVSQETKRNLDDNNPNMLKNVVERDIAAINATTAKLGAKIYVSGYPARLVPGDLGWELVDAYTDFNDRCSDLGEEYSSRPVDDRATGFGDELDLNTILTDTTPYALSECWCFTEAGYEKQGDKCVKK